MFKSSKCFKDIGSSCWSEEPKAELTASLKKHLEKVFGKERFSFGECKGVLNGCLSRTVDEGTKALMHLVFAAEAAELSVAYDDFGKRFYNSLESSAEKFLDYTRLPLIFQAPRRGIRKPHIYRCPSGIWCIR